MLVSSLPLDKKDLKLKWRAVFTQPKFYILEYVRLRVRLRDVWHHQAAQSILKESVYEKVPWAEEYEFLRLNIRVKAQFDKHGDDVYEFNQG